MLLFVGLVCCCCCLVKSYDCNLFLGLSFICHAIITVLLRSSFTFYRKGHANINPSTAYENNIAQPKADKCPSSTSHFHRLTVVQASFCSLIKGITPKIRMFYLVLINRVLFNHLCVWILIERFSWICRFTLFTFSAQIVGLNKNYRRCYQFDRVTTTYLVVNGVTTSVAERSQCCPWLRSRTQSMQMSYFISTLLLTLLAQPRIIGYSVFLGWAEGP